MYTSIMAGKLLLIGRVFMKNDKTSFYMYLYGCPVIFLLQQLLKQITFHIFKIQDKGGKIFVVYCLDLLYLIGRLNCYNVVLKSYFR